MTTPRYKRVIRVEFVGIDVLPVTDLRVAFKVDQGTDERFYHCSLKIWNLSANNRAKITRAMPLKESGKYVSFVEPVIRVRLFVGYEGDIVRIFAGDVQSAHAEQDGPDWITSIELWTGLAIGYQRYKQPSFAKETEAKVIIADILNPLGVSTRYTQEADDILNGKIIPDFSDSGLSFDLANRFLKRYGLQFSIEDDGQGLVFRPTVPRNKDAVSREDNTFSAINGLIGTPKITTSGIELVSLLRPQIKINDKFFVDSKSISQTLQNNKYKSEYVAQSVSHVGDTHGDEWFTDIVGNYLLIST
jgi:hypothetical protein